MLQLIYELRKNCCGRDGWTDGESKVLQKVLADLKREQEQTEETKETAGKEMTMTKETEQTEEIGKGHMRRL